MTPRQQAVVDFVGSYLAAHGRPPALKEIAAALGVSRQRATQLVIALERAGHVVRGVVPLRNATER